MHISWGLFFSTKKLEFKLDLSRSCEQIIYCSLGALKMQVDFEFREETATDCRTLNSIMNSTINGLVPGGCIVGVFDYTQ